MTSKFWSLLCYFFVVKCHLSIAFHLQTDSQTKFQNSTIEAYLRVFVNFEQNHWARLLPIAKFAYNNAKNASTGYTSCKLNCGYYSRMLYKDHVDPRSISKAADELSAKLREMMIVCRKNLYYAQKFQKPAHNKGIKPRTYVPSNKVWLNSKYIKTNQNPKLEAKFFRLFQVTYHVEKQVYKLELSKKRKIHNVFHMSLQEYNIIKKGREDDNVMQINFDPGNNSEGGEYKMEAIWNSAVYAKDSKSGYLPGFYYLLS